MKSEEAWEVLKKHMDENPEVYIHFYKIDKEKNIAFFAMQKNKDYNMFSVFLRSVPYINEHAEEVERTHGFSREAEPWERRAPMQRRR